MSRFPARSLWVALLGLSLGTGCATGRPTAQREAHGGQGSPGGGDQAKRHDRGHAQGAEGQTGAPRGPAPSDTAALAARLAGEGLTGWIHGAIAERQLFVFTYRQPGDFFTFAEFPLIPADEAVARTLAQVKRHDRVKLFGAFVQHGAPQRHIRVHRLETVKGYQSPVELPPPADAAQPQLERSGQLVGKVHALGDSGRVLVVEQRGAVIPVLVADAKLTEGLYRNDKIRLAYVRAPHPSQPSHLWLDTSAERPLEVLHAIRQGHGEPVRFSGPLVRFPESPQIKFDVFALQQTDDDGVNREYTLVNFKDQRVFAAIRQKLLDAWQTRADQAVDGRNKLVNPAVRVHAKGTLNVLKPDQANPQILLESPDDIEIELLPRASGPTPRAP